MPSWKRFPSRFIQFLAFAFAVQVASPCLRAETAGAEVEAASLEVVLVSTTPLDATLSARIASWFRGDPIRVTVLAASELNPNEILAPAEGVTLRAWVAFDAAQARLYFSARNRYLLRVVELENGLDEIGAERVSEVLHLSALALLDGSATSARAELENSLGQHVAVSPPPKTEPLATELALERELSRQPAPVVAARPARFEFGLGYGLASHSAEGYWHGPRLDVAFLSGTGFGAALVAQAALPATHSLGTIDVRILALAASAVARASLTLNRTLALELCGGPGVTFVDYAPQGSNAGVTLGVGGTEWRPHLLAGTALATRPGRFRLALAFEVELSLARTRYELRAGTGARTVAEPALWAPRAALELRY